MAKKKKRQSGVWGIDIGQCGLKALRCVEDDDDENLFIADAFDFIEYPKVLSQPDADADELIRDALSQFLERNETKGDKIAMSVSGQAGLSRFFKPPPVDAKMIPDIVKYEARQQIPFALEDVIWDYQRIGGMEVDGFVMDAEVGIFAMKRDAVFRALQPFLDADVEVDIVQLAPLSIYNVVCHDILTDLPAPEDVDPENPPESLVILSVGTETTDLVITNGTRLWQRNIPLGGNHFTKQLTKELKLTYAKAEHLKRNARQAEDPKTVFQVMRPVFNDLVTEIQRSVGYFQSIDRQAKIGKMVLLGNAVKLPGLRQYLSKNLGQEVIKLDTFDRLTGSSVLEAKSFKENALSFGVCYGLCLQTLNRGKISTNLLPREFITERLIRAKKPWAVVSVASLLLAFAFNYFFAYNAWSRVHPELQERTEDGTTVTYNILDKEIEQLGKQSGELMKKDAEQLAQLAHIDSLGNEVIGDGDRRILWPELLKSILSALPKDPRFEPGSRVDPLVIPYKDREDFHIEYIESQYFQDLAVWYNASVKSKYQVELVEMSREAAATAGETKPDNTGAAPAAKPAVDDGGGPKGPGWVFEIKGYHFHNSSDSIPGGWSSAYVRNTLLKNLRLGPILDDESRKKLGDDRLEDNARGIVLRNHAGDYVRFTYAEMGLGYPILVDNPQIQHSYRIKNLNHPDQAGRDLPNRGAAGAASEIPREFEAPRYDFLVQFCWQEKLLTDRLEALRIRLEEEKKKQPPPAAIENPAAEGEPAAKPMGEANAAGAVNGKGGM